jgi:hypothetical protein
MRRSQTNQDHFRQELIADKDNAFQWLEKAYQERSKEILWLKVEPKLDGLRSDKRFNALLKKVGLDT